MERRTMESHPGDRISDKGFSARVRNWWGPGRGYRDIWMICISGVVLLALNSNKNVNEITQKLAIESSRLSVQANQLSNQIQDSREEFFMFSCSSQNKRNAKTIKELDDIINAIPSGEARTNAERSRSVTVRLISQLSPTQNCTKLIKEKIKVP